MRPSPLIGYLSGTLDNADLLRGVLTDAKEETWLILGRKEYEQRRVRRSDDLLDIFSERKRLLIREGTIDSGQYERTVVRFSLGAVLGKLRTINLIML